MQTLRRHGHYDAYLTHLDPVYRADLLALIAGTWVPVELGRAHYQAADRLGLDVQTIDAFGAEVGQRVNKTLLSLAVKISKEGGVTPWTALARTHRLLVDTWDGSDVSVTKLGPKDARFDWVAIPYASIPYYVTSFGGFLRSLVTLFSSKASTRLVHERSSATVISYRLSWA
jgi:hypothetical protein